MKHFMLDIETMGTDFESDDIIQIGLLELTPASDGTYIPGRAFQRTLYTNQKPKNAWIANTHRELLQVCRYSPRMTPEQVRSEILAFFRECGVNEPAMIMGLNATTFDIPYMVQKGYLRKPVPDQNNRLAGDYHYRIYELKGAYNLAQNVTGLNSKLLFERAEAACPEVVLPEGKKHEALYDCYRQLKVLNGIIRLLRRDQAA